MNTSNTSKYRKFAAAVFAPFAEFSISTSGVVTTLQVHKGTVNCVEPWALERPVRHMWCTHVKRDVKHDTWCETRCEVYTIPRVWAMRAMTRLKLSFSRRNIKRIKRIKLPQAIAKVMEGRCDFQRFFQAVCERPKGIRVGRICRGLRCWLQVPPFEELCNGDMWWFGGWNCRLDRHRRHKSKSEVLKQEKGQTCCGKKCFLGESCDNWSTLDLKILKLELHDEFLWKLDLLKTFDEFLWICWIQICFRNFFR